MILKAKIALYNFAARCFDNSLIESFRIHRLRRKSRIKVAFILENLAAWKSEPLYCAMLGHERFSPHLYLVKTYQEDDRKNLSQHCSSKNYPFSLLEEEHSVFDYDNPDIVVYQKPYKANCKIDTELKPFKFHKTLYIYLSYALNSSIQKWSYDTPLLRKCWQVYYENMDLASQYHKLLGQKKKNAYATRLPMMDELQLTHENLADPWKNTQPKKRIIYAPHHSINNNEWFDTGTFLKNGDAILQLAKNYSDRIQWAFKPHPLMRNKLYKVWGKKRTDAYYNEWSNVEWSQYETGKYLALFHYSDAIIHDCGAFLMEYLYTGKPCMYLIKHDKVGTDWNDFYRKALNCYYHSHNLNDIEVFINNVINDNDCMFGTRDKFRRDYLVTPDGATAIQNIINCILDANQARQMRVK